MTRRPDQSTVVANVRRRVTGAIAMALSAPVALAGCGVPGSGDAMVVEEVNHGDDSGDSGNITSPPSPTTDAVTTVENFLRAAPGDPNSRDERLDRFVDEAGEWSEPAAGIQIVRLSHIPELSGTDALTEVSVTATGSVIGVYGQHGQVVRSAGGTEYEVEFLLRRDTPDTRWKLVDPPSQVTMDDKAFSSNYKAQPLYFPARGDSGVLVPDLRWVPNFQNDSGTKYAQLADWLLQGPSDWISTTVSSAFPAGMVRRSSVTVDGDEVSIDLSTENVTGKADQYRTMSAQLAWSLGLKEDDHLSLFIDGQDRLSEKVSTWSGRSRAPVNDEPLVDRELVYYISDGKVQSADETAPFAGEHADGLRDAVLEPRGRRMAAVINDGSDAALLVGTPGELEQVEGFKAGSLEDPQWLDRERLLVLADGRPTVVTIDTGAASTITATTLGDSPRQFALAPDARRLAYVSDGHAFVVPVVHTDDDRTPISFGEPRRVGTNISAVVDVGWSQETQLLIVGEVPGAQEWLWKAFIDNATEDKMDGTAGSAITKADGLVVRCHPPKMPGTVGQPVVVEITGSILRVYVDQVKQIFVTGKDGDETEAVGYDPFVLG
ncbi:LpqB family beta-propeller domain-containing protein [Stackebrandtia soli]|uniref:LpqB family beta-propeller domain-containing protein n=1 Tax=Stackebrandtia soli TaxID=1892856 RepID=UPI0039E73197